VKSVPECASRRDPAQSPLPGGRRTRLREMKLTLRHVALIPGAS